MSLIAQLYQDRTWRPRGATADVPLEDLEPAHRRKILRWLEEHAEELKSHAEFDILAVSLPTAENAGEAYDAECDWMMRSSGREWLDTLPLVERLRSFEVATPGGGIVYGFRFRVVDRNPVHVRVVVYAGEHDRTPGACGQLTFRVEEWGAFVEMFGNAPREVAGVAFPASGIQEFYVVPEEVPS